MAVRKQTTSETCFGNVTFKDPLVLDPPLVALHLRSHLRRWMPTQCNTNFDEAREIRTEGASVYATDHGTRRRRGGVSRICRSGHRSSASSDGKTTTLHQSRTKHSSQTCLMVDLPGMSVFAACRSLVPFAFDRGTHDLLERCARREQDASMHQYCTGFICTCYVRKRPVRPMRLRMVARVQMLAGDATTGRSCRPSCAD